METAALRQIIAAGAATMPKARVWPNGIGFSIGEGNWTFSEQAQTWIYSTEYYVGVGVTPTAAKNNRAYKLANW